MAIIEFVDRDVSAKGQDFGPGDDGRGFRRSRLIGIADIEKRPRGSGAFFFGHRSSDRVVGDSISTCGVRSR